MSDEDASGGRAVEGSQTKPVRTSRMGGLGPGYWVRGRAWGRRGGGGNWIGKYGTGCRFHMTLTYSMRFDRLALPSRVGLLRCAKARTGST